MTTQLLDCGHTPTVTDGCGTGSATDRAGRTMCYDCANAGERDALKTGDTYTAYLTRDTATNQPVLTTWPGGALARVTAVWETSIGGFLGRHKITRFRAVDVHGAHWYVTSP